MDRNGILTLILLFSIVADTFVASQSRKLVTSPPNNSTSTQGSPSPIPVPAGKKSKIDAPAVDNSSKADADSSKNGNPVSEPTGKQTESEKKNSEEKDKNREKINTGKESEKSDQNKEIDDKKANSESGSNGSCEGVSGSCTQEKMVACVLSVESGSKEWAVLVQNVGESTLNVNLTAPTATKGGHENLNISKHHTERVNISVASGERTKIILNTGSGKCEFHVDPPVSETKLFLQLPSYSKLVTPINGAYFLLLTSLIVGGSWACCKFRKRRRLRGVPYQELEMGLPESVSAESVDTAEGWDQGWDDDWDEDKAVKPPGGHHGGNISKNGLTSRSPNRDGWEKDWDE